MTNMKYDPAGDSPFDAMMRAWLAADINEDAVKVLSGYNTTELEEALSITELHLDTPVYCRDGRLLAFKVFLNGALEDRPEDEDEDPGPDTQFQNWLDSELRRLRYNAVRSLKEHGRRIQEAIATLESGDYLRPNIGGAILDDDYLDRARTDAARLWAYAEVNGVRDAIRNQEGN